MKMPINQPVLSILNSIYYEIKFVASKNEVTVLLQTLVLLLSLVLILSKLREN